ncbi:MAG: hypothetical protein PHD22_08380, partial [Zoogloea sp.]|nr:hypothetical protein [Zoogloea sp.]
GFEAGAPVGRRTETAARTALGALLASQVVVGGAFFRVTEYRKGLTLDEARRLIAEEALAAPELQQFSDFIAESGRGIVR